MATISSGNLRLLNTRDEDFLNFQINVDVAEQISSEKIEALRNFGGTIDIFYDTFPVKINVALAEPIPASVTQSDEAEAEESEAHLFRLVAHVRRTLAGKESKRGDPFPLDTFEYNLSEDDISRLVESYGNSRLGERWFKPILSQ